MASLYGSGETKDLQALLQGVNLLGQEISDSTALKGKNDPGASALESVTATITKGAGAAVAALGGTSAVTAFIGKSWGNNVGSRTSIIFGASIVAAASVLALAVLIASDLRARSQSQSAMYNARAAVVIEFMKFFPPPSPKAQAAPKSDNQAGKPAAEPAAPSTCLSKVESALVFLATTQQRGVRVSVDGNQPDSGVMTGIREHKGDLQISVQLDGLDAPTWFAVGDVHLVSIPAPRALPEGEQD